MIRRTKTGPLVFEDFLAMVSEDQKADLIDGVIYLASPENLGHNQLKLWLSTLLDLYNQHRQLGLVLADKFAFRLSDRTSPEPDLAFVRKDRLHLVNEGRGYMDGPPDLAVEIVSPDSVDRDYEDKRQRYEEAGVREYWVINPMEQAALFLILTDDGFAETLPDHHIFQSEVLPGLALDVRWLWQRPFPSTLSIVQRLLETGLT